MFFTKQLVLALLALCSSGSLFSSWSKAQEVQWLRSPEQAAEIAAKTGKPILVYIRSAACHYCDLMQKNVWQDPETARIVMRDFVPLKLTREDDAESIEVLQIKGYPSTLLFSSQREYVSRLDGYVEPPKLLSAMQQARTLSKSDASLR